MKRRWKREVDVLKYSNYSVTKLTNLVVQTVEQLTFEDVPQSLSSDF